MITVNCEACGKSLRKSPSKVNPRNYCGMQCYSQVRDKEFANRGSGTRFTPGHKPTENRQMPSGTNHYAWKEGEVGYRGLHYWLRRQKGIPTACVECGFARTGPKSVQWANIDGEYHRTVEDYIALCVSCHKNHDLAIKTKSGVAASRRYNA